ncbi:hypothetical protein GCM10027566_13430 [Arachidicoccus ginsenosidivorans]|uniref:Uncharacterized protein n=1 Tax=Arachidicoccus ginsenosidivorans TaxID=496057 RepID=A0A5B8VNR4_9BACT|nr:hypothetical protein [Arachidicoccus ginsenosidivorans]QEC73049.1 hypothetical protein FSB73_16555 [Arachidicoccus ginsenosidivorans]
MMQKDSKVLDRGMFLTKMVLFVWAIGAVILGCGPVKKSSQTISSTTSPKGAFNLQTAMRRADTTAIRQLFAGTWTLDRMCRSSFVGLKCDTTIEQQWQLDSLGGISWMTEGENALKDRYRFVPKTGAQAGTTKKVDTAWVLFLNKANRGYLIRALSKDSLTISEYPLIMDNTVTYYLSR